MSLANKNVLITGASRGIGQAIANTFAGQGARVVGTATTSTGAQAIQESLAAYNGCGVVLDVTQPQSITDLFNQLNADERAPEIVINNAGITRDNLLARMAEEDWHNVIETNLSAIYRICKASSRSMMKARFGRIINISSVVAAIGNAGQSNYAAAKAGMEGFTRALARELGARNITVNCVAPGFIDTDMTRKLGDTQRQGLLNQIPLRRLGDVQDIATAVLFLASDDARYITGETLHVNGGMHMG